MSLSQIESEIAGLSAEELLRLQNAISVEIDRKTAAAPADPRLFFGSLANVMSFHPGWDEDAPIEMWEAHRDVPL